MAASKKKPTPTQLGARRREIMNTIDALTKEKAEIDAELNKLDPSYEAEGDGIKLSFTAVRSLDTATIIKKFPASKRPEFYKLTLDTAEFKKHFSAHDLEPFQTVGRRINVKEV